MNLYRITWTELNAGYVRADTESAARQAWIDGDLDDIESFEQSITELVTLEADDDWVHRLLHPESCVHCGKVLHREIHDGSTFLIDQTGGDVCGSYGTYGNEPHVSSEANDV